MKDPARIVIVDDHPIFRNGLSQSLAERPDFLVCGQGASAEEAVRLTLSLAPDIVLLDLSMPGGGHDALVRILQARPETRILVLTASEDDDDVLRALGAGAKGYVVKGIGADELCDIIDVTLSGGSYVSPQLAARILAELGPGPAVPTSGARQTAAQALSELTPREEEILRLVAKGYSNKRIARALDLQEKTIKNHMTRILGKLNARSRLEAALMVRDAGVRD